MALFRALIFLSLLAGTLAVRGTESQPIALLGKPWYELRSPYLRVFSCAPTQDVAKLTMRLEQFRQTYATLAGTQAVASPPVIVMVYPNHEALKPYLPVYQGQPANLAAFFVRGTDENLIVTSLAGVTTDALDNVYHEYAHLLLRRNDRIWPLWLKEGMADIYATFQLQGTRATVALPRSSYLRLLAHEPMMPLQELLEVTHDSPAYNERERQGIFYAQSWLLTHYLMLGDNSVLRSRFGQITRNLKDGQTSVEAFTKGLGISVEAGQNLLERYRKAGKFAELQLVLSTATTEQTPMTFRPLPKTEVCFWLGNQLLRVQQLEVAERYFSNARELSPSSPLAYEGLGLTAVLREQDPEAMGFLGQAIKLNSGSFLTYYFFAREKLRQTRNSSDGYRKLEKVKAEEIRKALNKAITIMPDFGPAHHLLGFFEVIQREDLNAAETQLQKALELEPDNESYLLALAQAQLARQEWVKARKTLEAASRPSSDEKIRAAARELLNRIDVPGR
jgi:tetratricopeptide (TPR) repeat protein